MTHTDRKAGGIEKRLAFIVTLLAICLGAILLFVMLAGLVEPLPFWARMVLLFLVPIVLLSGLGSLAHSIGTPRGWLVLAAGGLLLALAPALLYWVHGSWEAEFTVPRRGGRTITLEVASFGLWAALMGVLLTTMGLTKYVLGVRK